MMKDNTYVVIQSWMRTELNLSGNELIVYAIIYGFSQDKENTFTGSRQYLADWCGCSVRSIQTILNDLTEQKLLTKIEGIYNGTKVCKYIANFTSSAKFAQGSEKFSPNNIDNKLEINNTKVLFNNIETCTDTTSVLANKPKKKNLFEKITDSIQEYTNDNILRNELYSYRDMLLEISKYGGKPVYANVFKGKLNSLSALSNDTDTQIKIVQQSVSRGWINFYALQSNTTRYKDPMNESGVVRSMRADMCDIGETF